MARIPSFSLRRPGRIATAGALAALVLLAGLPTSVPAGASRTVDQAPDSRSSPRRCTRELGERLDATLDRLRPSLAGPGVQAALVRNGRVLWSAERGNAIDGPDTPVDPSSLFAFASFGKVMLSAYALHLVESGTLDLDTPISKYVGDSVAGSNVVTLRMLLTHTSGYPDVYSAPEVAPLFADQYYPDRAWSFATLAPGIHEPVDPAARWEYSNTGFIVLAHVLDAVANAPLPRAYRQFVARAGLDEHDVTMRRSRFALRHFAHGYTVSGPNVSDSFAGATGIPTDLYGLPWGDGAFAGTASGAAQFLDAVFGRGRLLRAKSVRRMIEPSPQSLAAGRSGEIQSYGMGTATYEADGHAWVGHDGTYSGFTSMGATDRKRGVSIAVVTNRQLGVQQPAIVLWRALAEAYANGPCR